jgi:hypothetical protein
LLHEEYDDQGSCHELQNNMCQLDTANTIVELDTDGDSYRNNHITEELPDQHFCDSQELSE